MHLTNHRDIVVLCSILINKTKTMVDTKISREARELIKQYNVEVRNKRVKEEEANNN